MAMAGWGPSALLSLGLGLVGAATTSQATRRWDVAFWTFGSKSTADLSERDNKEILVVKEEEKNDAEVFGVVVVEMARLLKEP